MSIPAKPTLTNAPPIPQRTDPPTTFSDKADTYVAWQTGYRDELVAAIDWQNTVFTATETEATNATNSATASANSATASANSATASANSATESEGYKDTAETAAAAAQSAAGLPSLAGSGGKVLKADEDEQGVSWGAGLISEYQEFTTSGTWTKDPNATWVYVEGVGAGGGGRNETDVGLAHGAGGGAFNQKLLRASDVGATETVTVGAGGLGGANGSSSDGSDGGDSTFGTHLSCPGGDGATSFLAGTGGASGRGFSGIYPISGYASGSGGHEGTRSSPGGDSVKGGAGGGADDAAGGNSLEAGDGGDGNNDAGVAGGNGAAPGGGGGASKNDGGGGNGADGRIRIWQW